MRENSELLIDKNLRTVKMYIAEVGRNHKLKDRFPSWFEMETSFFAKYKQLNLGRFLVNSNDGKAELIPVEVAPTPKPQLKRSQFRMGKAAQIAPKRTKGSPEVIIMGSFTKISFCKADGFVIGKFKLFDSSVIYTVRGRLPVIDEQYCYQLKCTEIFKGTVQYRIDALHSTKDAAAIQVLPLTGMKFREILCRYCKLTQTDAQKIVFEVYAPLASENDYGVKNRLKITSIIIPFDYLCRNFAQTDWFIKLSLLWTPLRYRDFPKLLELGWSTAALSRLTSMQIDQLSFDLTENPWNYLVPDRNIFGLAAISESCIPALNNLFKTEISQLDLQCIHFYHQISEFVQNKKQIALNENEITNIAIENNVSREVRTATFAPRRRLIKVHYEREEAVRETFYYRYHEFEALQRLPALFSRIIERDATSVEPPTEAQYVANEEVWKKIKPNPEQMECYRRLATYNILLIDGGPGSGKSTIMRLLRTRYHNSTIGFFVSYGVIAHGLTESMGIEFMTLAMAIDQIEKQTAEGKKLQELEVAFIDEISLVDIVIFSRFLEAMEGLKVLVMAGDHCQNTSIAPGPIIYGMLKKWKGTYYMQSLITYYRASNPILLDNLNRLRKGRYDIEYATELESEHPFILRHRHAFPEELNKLNAENRIAKVSILKKDLESIYNYYYTRDPDLLAETMLCTQRIVDVSLLNHAWWCIKFNHPITAPYDEFDFAVGETVMFCGENLNNPDYKRAPHLRSSRVMHGSTAVISAIWDFLPYWDGEGDPREKAKRVQSTGMPKNYDMDRVIEFTNGMQINMRDYPINMLKRGYAVTTSSIQGLQCEMLIYYIQPGRTPYLTRQEFYTGCSRSRSRVIVICEANSEALHTSDIARITNNKFALTSDIVPYYLPEFREKTVAPAPETNPFDVPKAPSTEVLGILSNSSLFGGFFSGLKLTKGIEIFSENAQSY